ncbi:MAG: hypothetical protein KBC35_00425 [Candidatus Pacebacteria bacterium]|nr:hypothetical protein [Candidatus Paceibacterota bacterium]
MRTISIFFILFLCLVTNEAAAQFDISSFTQPQQGIELQPEFPRPGESVTARFNDYQDNSYGATITWVLDGKVIPGTENQREISIIAGEAGKKQTLQVVFSKEGVSTGAMSTTLTPVYLDIIIEPQTRTPDFYLGRSLPSIGSLVNVTALISGKGFLNPDLVYTWRFGQQIIDGGSLRGRNRISLTMPRGRSEVLSVEVARLDGTIIARRSLYVPSVTPEIQFYEVSPLFGISKKAAVAGVPLISNSAVIQAVPYYLDTRVYNDPDIIKWELGGVTTDNPAGNPYEITLQRTGITGSVELNFHVRDTDQVLQGAEGSTRINF